MWFTRPLSPSLLKILALEATYLLPLRLVLLDAMMSDLTTLVDGYLNAYREGSADRLGGMEVGELSVVCLQDFRFCLIPQGGHSNPHSSELQQISFGKLGNILEGVIAWA